jgi:cell division protein FtsI (penicillin-binding protein 3)
LAVAVVIAIVAVFSVRLFDLQVVQAAQLNKDSFDKRAIGLTVYAPRGNIVASDGTLLATSVTRWDLVVSPKALADNFRDGVWQLTSTSPKITLLDAAGKVAALTKQDPSVVYQAFTKDPTSDYALVTKAVDTATMRAVLKLGIPTLVNQMHPQRTYPDGAVAGNLVGFLGTDGPLNGLEYTENSCLASTNGTETYERGADGVQIPGSVVTTKPSKPGGTLKLTIDPDLQWFATQAIAEQAKAIGAVSATAVIIRVKDAHLLAVADYPAVDPNNVSATSNAYFGSLAFSAQYEPGSVFKGMSAAILLDTGYGNPLSQAVVPSTWHTPEGGVVHDAAPHPVQHLTLTGVLQNSSNVGISMLGSKVPASIRYDYMKKFGIGTRTAVDFQGERTDTMANYTQWDSQTKYNVLYGQGVTASALQVAGIYQTLGNNGVRLPLQLVEGCEQPDGSMTDVAPTAGTRVVSDATAKTVVNMLESVVQGGELSKTVKIPGYRVAGKSGTAEVAENGRYSSDRIVSFVGLAPANDPQYEVLVTYTKPATMKSSAAAAPTFKKIMTQVLTKYRVPPSTTPLNAYPATTW